MPTPPKLTEADRRAIALAILRAGEYGSVSELAWRYGVSRGRLYQIAYDYTDAEKLARMADEVEFRREMVALKDSP